MTQEQTIAAVIERLNPTHCTQRQRLCSYDRDVTSYCLAKNDEYTCTRSKGHDGPHIACGYGHNLASWPNLQRQMKSTIESEAAKRIGQTVTVTRGICRATVTIEAYRVVYGRLEYLVRAGDQTEWLRAESITWGEPQPLTT